MKDIAEQAVDWLKKQGAEAEVYVARSEERGIERRHGKLDGIQQSGSEGTGLRVLSEGRMGFACSGGVSLEIVKDLYEKIKGQLPHLERDEYKNFPDPRPATSGLDLWDDTLFTEEWDSVTRKLEGLEAAATADKLIASVLRAGYGEARGEVIIAGTRGVMTSERGASCSVGLSTLSSEGETQVGSAYQSARKRAELDWAKVGRQCAERTVQLLGAVKPPTGTRSVVFDPWVSGEFLDLVSGLLCADQVQRGKSLLSGKMGKQVGSSLVTFVDDPRRPGGLASSVFDDEGLPTARKTMIEKGVVKQFFYDAYTAKREGVASNASAGRGSYRGLPGPGPTNFYLEPGAQSREALLADTKNGILVLDVMGMHMADPISGEFSVGVSGLLIENGKLGKPVKAAMISGNLLELLDRVDAVADDLTFYGGMGAPTFRVSRMTVA